MNELDSKFGDQRGKTINLDHSYEPKSTNFTNRGFCICRTQETDSRCTNILHDLREKARVIGLHARISNSKCVTAWRFPRKKKKTKYSGLLKGCISSRQVEEVPIIASRISDDGRIFLLRDVQDKERLNNRVSLWRRSEQLWHPEMSKLSLERERERAREREKGTSRRRKLIINF